MREIATLAEVRLSCRGPALGKKQRAASAMGGVQEDKTGVTDGISR